MERRREGMPSTGSDGTHTLVAADEQVPLYSLAFMRGFDGTMGAMSR